MSSDAYLGGDEATQLVRDVPNEYYDLLSSSRRLRLLSLLETATEPPSTTALATELAQREGTDPRSVELSLVHAHLPKLAAHDIVEYDRDGVVLLDETPVPPSGLVSLLESDSVDERLFEALIHPVRLVILETLERSGTRSLGALASSLAETDHVDSFETAELVLHHTHIPTLVDVGAVQYDEHSRVVTAEFQTLTVE